MRAAVLTGIGQVRIEDRPEPTAPPGWVVVRVESASSPRHCAAPTATSTTGASTPRFPGVPGHDFAGRVDSVGDGVDEALIGAPVAVKPSLPCVECADCSAGKLADCKRRRLIGLWSDGCMTELSRYRR